MQNPEHIHEKLTVQTKNGHLEVFSVRLLGLVLCTFYKEDVF